MNNQDSWFAIWLELNDDLAQSNIIQLSREDIIDPKELKK